VNPPKISIEVMGLEQNSGHRESDERIKEGGNLIVD
jgi:hypothetical protein